MEKETISEINSYLTFKLGKESFAINVGSVLSILEVDRITEVPKAPNYMKGVINLRGTVLPVVDTRVKFGMTPVEVTNSTCILVLDVKVDGEAVKVGAMVDSVEEVIELNEEDIQPPPNIGSKYKSEFIYGMAKSNDDFIMLLDMDKVFSTDEIIDLKENLPKGKDAVEVTK
jgi:purine-binding chemotaxis protein CheW